MSETINKKSVIKNKTASINRLNNLLDEYIDDKTGKHIKKANLISYWLKDYVRYLEFEEKFDPKRYIAYKRGDVIKVSFGFNVGAEYGGLHYAVVLDNHNEHASPVVTVVPLTSTKDSKFNRHNVSIGDEIYRLMKLKAQTAIKTSIEARENINSNILHFKNLLELVHESKQGENVSDGDVASRADTVELLEQTLNELKLQSKHLTAVTIESEKILSEISRMKEGSTVLVGQITTISKMRIYDPQKTKDVLHGITLSKENMDKINEKIKELYIFTK